MGNKANCLKGGRGFTCAGETVYTDKGLKVHLKQNGCAHTNKVIDLDEKGIKRLHNWLGQIIKLTNI